MNKVAGLLDPVFAQNECLLMEMGPFNYLKEPFVHSCHGKPFSLCTNVKLWPGDGLLRLFKGTVHPKI